jgi:hypothetical protein
MLENIDELYKNIMSIKSTVNCGMPQVNKDRRINNACNMALDLLKVIKNDFVEANNGV